MRHGASYTDSNKASRNVSLVREARGDKMKCYTCGSELRITLVKGKPYCFRCEADASLVAYGVIRLDKGEKNVG
jgi:ribosomal protein L37AE/L43A